MTNVLDQLRTMTTVVADTGGLAAVRTYEPIDCTTNPSLVLKALEHAASEGLVAREIEAGKTVGMTPEEVAEVLTVAMGAELAALVPGRVSTEVEASLSFDTESSALRACAIINEYNIRGVDKSQLTRVLAPDKKVEITEAPMEEVTFRWRMNGDAMATEKLAEGVRNFDMDHQNWSR